MSGEKVSEAAEISQEDDARHIHLHFNFQDNCLTWNPL